MKSEWCLRCFTVIWLTIKAFIDLLPETQPVPEGKKSL
jgi:hypothetical protein